MEKIKAKSLLNSDFEKEIEFEKIGDIWVSKLKWPKDYYLILEETRKRLENIPDELLYGFYKIGNILYEGYSTNETYLNELKEREKGLNPTLEELKNHIKEKFDYDCTETDYAGHEALKIKGTPKDCEITVAKGQYYKSDKSFVGVNTRGKTGGSGSPCNDWKRFDECLKRAFEGFDIKLNQINPTEVKAFKQLTIFDFMEEK